MWLADVTDARAIARPARAGLVLLLALLVQACAPRLRPDIRSAPDAGPAVASVPSLEPRAPSTGFDAYLRARPLVMPVAGADATRVRDSFADARDGGARVHRAIDIMAPRGTPVLAADDGKILRMRSNTLGGITIYASDPAGRIVYYYAHLDRYHPGREEGMTIARGDTLGYVGTTGNAPANAPHLHFQVMRVLADGRWWDGEPVNPLPLLRSAQLAQQGRGEQGTVTQAGKPLGTPPPR